MTKGGRLSLLGPGIASLPAHTAVQAPRNDTLGAESRDSFRFWFSVTFDGAGVRVLGSSGKAYHSSKAEQSLFSGIALLQ
jgi:hypothetical protein